MAENDTSPSKKKSTVKKSAVKKKTAAPKRKTVKKAAPKKGVAAKVAPKTTTAAVAAAVPPGPAAAVATALVSGPAVDPVVRHAAIEKLAYLLAESRGFEGGNAEDDWFSAEAQVDARIAAGEDISRI